VIDIDRLVADARSALIVTHDLDYVLEACDEALWLDGGLVAAAGDPREVVNRYLRAVDGALPARAIVDTA